MNKQLRKISTSILWIIRILIVALPLMYILAWMFPNNSFSINAVIAPALDGRLITNGSLLLNNQLLGLAGSLVALFPLWLGFLWLNALFQNYAQEIIFTLENAKIYAKLGWLCMLSALIIQPLTDAIFSIAATINNPPGHRVIALGFTNTNFTAITCGIFLIIVAKVMMIGHQIKEEQQLTI